MVLMVVAAGGGGTLLNELFDAGEGVVKSEIVQVTRGAGARRGCGLHGPVARCTQL
jgi:hypothetical protein